MTAKIENMLKDENAAWNTHDVDKIATFYTDDCIKEDIAIAKTTQGKKEMKAVISGAFNSIPDMNIKLVTIINIGNMAATEWIMSGSYSNVYPGWSSATGKKFSVRGATIMELRNGKISRISDYWNFASFSQQIGLTSPPSG
jgi:steroid delta-isomerase-like uncharacterized protein